MIESLIELSGGKVSGREIQQVIEIGKSIMTYPIELLPDVKETIESLKEFGYRLMIITKGDLFDQESKIARSGLADLFDIIEIVSEKNDDTYRNILKKHWIHPEQFWMVGNSLKSDKLARCAHWQPCRLYSLPDHMGTRGGHAGTGCRTQLFRTESHLRTARSTLQ